MGPDRAHASLVLLKDYKSQLYSLGPKSVQHHRLSKKVLFTFLRQEALNRTKKMHMQKYEKPMYFTYLAFDSEIGIPCSERESTS